MATDFQQLLVLMKVAYQLHAMLEERGIPVPDSSIHFFKDGMWIRGEFTKQPLCLVWSSNIFRQTSLKSGAPLIVQVELGASECGSDGDFTMLERLRYCGPDSGWYEIPPGATPEEIETLTARPPTLDDESGWIRVGQVLDRFAT